MPRFFQKKKPDLHSHLPVPFFSESEAVAQLLGIFHFRLPSN